MKQFLFIAAIAATILLAVALTLTTRNDTAQLATATSTITDFSNQLDSAQIRLSICNGTALIFSNHLNEAIATSQTLSNQLAAAQSTNALQAEQITGLNGRVAAATSENQALGGRLTDLTNQVVALTGRIAVTETNLTQTHQDLDQAHKDYAALQSRFLRDVAERVMVERRFNNLTEVQAQEKKLWQAGAPWVTPASIYAGLNVEVQSNGVVHVISPD